MHIDAGGLDVTSMAAAKTSTLSELLASQVEDVRTRASGGNVAMEYHNLRMSTLTELERASVAANPDSVYRVDLASIEAKIQAEWDIIKTKPLEYQY